MRRKLCTWLMSATLVLTAMPLTAECQDPCLISTLRPGILSVSLPIDHLFQGSGSFSEPTEVITEPRFGTLSREGYLPGSDFWSAGADLIRVRNRSTGEVGTVLIRAAEIGDASITHEDFEEHPVDQLDLRWIDLHLLGTPTLSPVAIRGQKSLAVNLATGIPTQSVEGTSTGSGYMGIDITLNNEAPGDPWNQTIFETVLVNMEGYAGIDLWREDDLTKISAWAGPALGCVSLCRTPWQTLWNGETYHLSLAIGRDDLENPTVEWGLTLAVNAADGSWSAADQLSGLSPPPPGSFLPGPSGLLSGTPSGKLYLDDVTSWNADLEALPGFRFEAFDDGYWSPSLSTQGVVTIVQTGTDLGPSGAINFAHPSPGSTAGWIDDGPDGSQRVTAHAQVGLGELALPPGSAFQLFSGTNASGANVFFVVVKIQSDGSAKVQARLRRSSGGFATSAWAPLNAEINDIKAAWSVNDDESATVRLWTGEQYREVEVAGAGSGAAVEGLTIGAKFLVLSQPVNRGGALLIDDVLLTY